MGFLTVIEDSQTGLCGGYLILDRRGRPLEFHCTVPFKPNRAQEILYGPTLRPYLFGEHIGAALVAKAGVAAQLVCTDCPPALAVRDFVDVPVVLVASTPAESSAEPADAAARRFRLDAGHELADLAWFEIGGHRLAVARACRVDEDEARRRCGELAEGFDLAEPFGRIHAAIAEAQRAAR